MAKYDDIFNKKKQIQPNKDSVFSKLRSFFNIGIKHDHSSETIVPVNVNSKTNKKTELQFPSDMKKFYDYWLKDCHDNAESVRNRFLRYDDMEYMVYNDTVISMAAEMYADESVQADSQSQVIQCEAEDDKVESYILSFLEKIGYSVDVIKETIRNMVIYGDHFNINSIDEKGRSGVEKTTPIAVRSVEERVEFNLLNEQRKLNMRQAKVFAQQDVRLNYLLDILKGDYNDAKKGKKIDYSKLFESYLFGYKLDGNLYLPPWNVSHFRLFSSNSEFYPYGRPLFIFALSPFRQLKAAKNLMAFARAANIPKEIYRVQTSPNMNQVETWEAIDSAYEQYNNLALTSTVRNDMGVGSQVWLPSELVDFEIKSPDINLDEIADIELLRDDMILGTRIPKGYLIVDRASFGTSGQALLQQFKPFGRAIFTLQSTFLKELTHLIKIHLLITNKFEGENTNFELSMNFPITEETDERLGTKSDTFRLATDIIQGIQDAIGMTDGLPPNVIKSIFKKLSFLDAEDIDKWIELSIASKNKQDSSLVNRDNNYWESNKNKIINRLNEQIIKSSLIRAKKKNKISESVLNNRHYVASWYYDKQHESIYDLLKTGTKYNLYE